MSALTFDDLEAARALAKAGKLAEAETAYRNLFQNPAYNNEKCILIQEQALNELGKLYRDHK